LCEGSHINSHGAGHPAISSIPTYTNDRRTQASRNALACFNQTFFESLAKAKTAWSHILSAAKRFGIDVSNKTMPRPKIKEPSSGYKRASALPLARSFKTTEPALRSASDEWGKGEGVLISTCAVAINSEDAPEWIELLTAGRFSAVDGRGPFDNADPDSIVEASVARMPEVGLVLDYDHSTDLAAPEGRPSIAAGWIKQFKVENGAILARIEWTAKAAEALKAKEYRYISPVFEHGKDGKVSRILRAALTNNPALTELPAIAAAKVTMAKKEEGARKLSEVMAGLEAMSPEASHGQLGKAARALMGKSFEDWADEEAEEHQMDGNGEDGDEEAEHADAYESEDAMARRHEEEMVRCTSDEMRAETTAQHSREKEEMAKRVKGLEVEGKPGGSKETSGMSSVRFNAAVARHPMVVQMAADLNQMRLAQARKTAENAVDAAIREGRLIPSHRDWAIDYCSGNPQGFEKFIGAAPKILQHGADGTFSGRIGEPPKGASALEQREINIFAALGLESKEQLEKCAAAKEKWDLRFPRPRLMLDGEKHE